jgi:hypothetical protein
MHALVRFAHIAGGKAVVHVINGRRVTVQQVRQPFTISVGKDL